MKKVKFFVWSEESDVYDFADDASDAELRDAVKDWIKDNIFGDYEVVEEEG